MKSVMETETNSIESHMECTRTKQQYGNHDFCTLLIKLKQEEIFFSNTNQFRKFLSVKIVHNEIIENIFISFVRDQNSMLNYIEDHLVTRILNEIRHYLLISINLY